MKTILYIVLLIACFMIIPARWIDGVFMPHLQISGDGEEAMNNYEFTAILIRLGISAIVAFVLLLLPRLFKR
ncbi:hypothetical protein [Enterobacter ludwigii]|uniref:hypothetical protein n=1 Tax=Enterobacter ludwigii TaxID=299767 RepID=UPI001E379F17|nr:hypothetical protein [Enterobacter ludwigii]MCE1916587.1 hypothetical protein [Enterobacter ludwigii]MCE2008943.1 hypothetical protein [Enterobacter ludwigii]MCR5990752.1 hypothetical protein [Enterobacter ludwigii]